MRRFNTGGQWFSWQFERRELSRRRTMLKGMWPASAEAAAARILTKQKLEEAVQNARCQKGRIWQWLLIIFLLLGATRHSISVLLENRPGVCWLAYHLCSLAVRLTSTHYRCAYRTQDISRITVTAMGEASSS